MKRICYSIQWAGWQEYASDTHTHTHRESVTHSVWQDEIFLHAFERPRWLQRGLSCLFLLLKIWEKNTLRSLEILIRCEIHCPMSVQQRQIDPCEMFTMWPKALSGLCDPEFSAGIISTRVGGGGRWPWWWLKCAPCVDLSMQMQTKSSLFSIIQWLFFVSLGFGSRYVFPCPLFIACTKNAAQN